MNEKKELVKYLQLAGILRERIERGVYEIGDRIPSYPELGRLFQVSEITVRRAVAILSNEGLLRMERGRGKGFFVQNNSPIAPHQPPTRRLGVVGSGGILSDDPAIQRGVVGALDGTLGSVYLLRKCENSDKQTYFEEILNQTNAPDALLINAHFFDRSEELTAADTLLKERGIPHVMIFPAEESDEHGFLARGFGGVYIQERQAMERAFATARSRGRNRLLFVGVRPYSVQRSLAVARRTKLFTEFQCEQRLFAIDDDLFSHMTELLSTIDSQTTVVLEGSNLPLCYFDSAMHSLKKQPGRDVSVFFFEHYCNLEPIFFPPLQLGFASVF